MICKYCGAEFEDNVLECPFCHGENTELADRMYKKQVGEVIGKIKNVKEETKKEERRISKKAVKVFIISVAVLVAAIALTHLASEVSSVANVNMEKEQEKAYLAELDAYYQKGDYDGLSEYYYSSSTFSFRAEKYHEVVYAWGQLYYIRRFKTGDTVYPITIYAILEDFNKLNRMTYEKTNDNTVYGNEEILLGFVAESEEFLIETLGMTEAQIEMVKEAQLESDSFDSTLQSITDEICNRLGIKEEY
jgi:hypothetical protein